MLRFDGPTAAPDIVRAYDVETDGWRLSLDSAFWKAVRHAHSIGRRGHGRRVAIIDSGCDMSIPRLAKCVDRVNMLVPRVHDDDPSGHGTAVALLVSEVAPDCRLDVYGVENDAGEPDERAVNAAIAEAQSSDADVINISVGAHRPIDVKALGRHRFRDKKGHGGGPCPLCDVATAAARRGKLVFASVGNELVEANCPAQAPGVVAVGFQELHTFSDGRTTMSFLMPAAGQALQADLFLQQPAGVLGSSFASPLYAGVAALGLSQSELEGYIDSYTSRTIPLRAHAEVETTYRPAAAAPVEQKAAIESAYRACLAQLPHVHGGTMSAIRPDAPQIESAACPFCGVFADLQYGHYGAWLAHTGRALEAIDLLEAARRFAPWNARVAASLGSAYFAHRNLSRAMRWFERAVALEPENPDYRDALAQVRNMPRRRLREWIDALLLRVFLRV